MEYFAVIHKEAGSDFGVSFPDFPGCVTAGSTLEEARFNAIEALTFHMEGMLEDGDDIPAPSSIDDIAGDLEGAVVLPVNVDLPGKTVRINITLNEGQLAKIDRVATASGQTRSGFMVDSSVERAFDYWTAKEAEILPPRRPRTGAVIGGCRTAAESVHAGRSAGKTSHKKTIQKKKA
jgi:predicted RNase H-like HicB family nuclease